MSNPAFKSSLYELRIKEMHKKFGIAYEGEPRDLPADEKAFRVACLLEELNEYAEADNLIGQYDALIDLLVFTFGSLERHGFPADEAFKAVMRANLAKEVGNNPHKKDEGRGAYKGVDLVKPAGWVGPEHDLARILLDQLEEYKYPR